MTDFPDYSQKYKGIAMRRDNGILEMRFHTEGGPMRWGSVPHRELEEAFLDVGRDRDNEVVIMTGTGKEFSGPTSRFAEDVTQLEIGATDWDRIQHEGIRLQMNLLDIPVPVIGVINGPATRHPEIPLLADIVLAADDATIQDSAHFQGGVVPGDGVHVLFPLAMGTNRARYFLLTGQTLTARQALEFGLVNEVLPESELLDRAWVHAREIRRRSALVRRYTRMLFTQPIKDEMQRYLGFGLALEGLGRMRGAG